MLSRSCIAIAVGALLALAASPAYAAPPPRPDHNPVGPIAGVVPSKAGGLHGGTSSNLLYHNGPVMVNNNVYAIYWIPSGYSVSTSYTSLVSRYFTDVATAGALNPAYTGFVYYTGTQYYEANGVNGCSATTGCHVTIASSLAGSATDATPFPANGCKDRYTKVCLSDAQIQTEINNVRASHGWPAGVGSLYFVFTPNGVGSCAGSSCAFSSYCAYHSWTTGTASSSLLYANMPYAMTVPGACGSGQSPNGDPAADSEISIISHEHNESITDPLGTAWYASNGYEDGDKCVWNFGTPIGGSSGAEYNQVINNNDYYLQQEWSNAATRCVLTGL